MLYKLAVERPLIGATRHSEYCDGALLATPSYRTTARRRADRREASSGDLSVLLSAANSALVGLIDVPPKQPRRRLILTAAQHKRDPEKKQRKKKQGACGPVRNGSLAACPMISLARVILLPARELPPHRYWATIRRESW